MNDARSLLYKIQTLEGINNKLESKEKDIQKGKQKLEMCQQVNEFYSKVDEQLQTLNQEIRELQQFSSKIEWISSQISSQQNSTPEVRAINQEMDNLLDKIHSVERKSAQLKVESSSLDNDIQYKVIEQNEDLAKSTEKSAHTFQEIHDKREESIHLRLKNLEQFIELQNTLTEYESRVQELSLSNSMYSQLNKSMQEEFQGYTDSIKGPLILKVEAEKLSIANSSIPVHQQIDDATIKKQTKKVLKINDKIHEIENSIFTLINQISDQERHSDNLYQSLHDYRIKSKVLSDELRREQGMIEDLETKIREKKEQDESKADEANNEIDSLRDEIGRLQVTEKSLKKQIDNLKDEKSIMRSMAGSPIVVAQRKLELDIERMNNERKELELQEKRLRSQLPTEF